MIQNFRFIGHSSNTIERASLCTLLMTSLSYTYLVRFRAERR